MGACFCSVSRYVACTKGSELSLNNRAFTISFLDIGERFWTPLNKVRTFQPTLKKLSCHTREKLAPPFTLCLCCLFRDGRRRLGLFDCFFRVREKKRFRDIVFVLCVLNNPVCYECVGSQARKLCLRPGISIYRCVVRDESGIWSSRIIASHAAAN